MIDRRRFFETVRAALFGGTMTQSQVDGISAVLDEWEAQPRNDARNLAYMLATDFHETNATMQAVREAYWVRPDAEAWRKANLRYYPFYGRGLVQLTWEDNYRKMSPVVGVDLVADPDAALDLANAVKIMFYGMANGTFTGRRLEQYFGPGKNDPVGARAIINGSDAAQKIAGYYWQFLKALQPA